MGSFEINILKEDENDHNILTTYHEFSYSPECFDSFKSDLHALFEYFMKSEGKLLRVGIYSDVELTKETHNGHRILVTEDEAAYWWLEEGENK